MKIHENPQFNIFQHLQNHMRNIKLPLQLSAAQQQSPRMVADDWSEGQPCDQSCHWTGDKELRQDPRRIKMDLAIYDTS
jgi:hypothetical protein